MSRRLVTLWRNLAFLAARGGEEQQIALPFQVIATMGSIAVALVGGKKVSRTLGGLVGWVDSQLVGGGLDTEFKLPLASADETLMSFGRVEEQKRSAISWGPKSAEHNTPA